MTFPKMERNPGFSEFKIEKHYMNVDGVVVQKFLVIGIDPEYYEAEEEMDRFDSYVDAENYIKELLTK